MQSQQVEKRDYLTLQEMGRACLKNWGWFVLSTVIMMSLAYVFMQKTKPIYVRKASLMLLTDRNNDMYKYSDLKVKGLGIETAKTNLTDEMGILRSPFMMEAVVKKLHIDVEYRIPGKFFNRLVYGKEVPVEVIFDDPSLSGVSLKLALKGNEQVVLSDFTSKHNKPAQITGKLGDTLATPFGKVIVNKKYNYDETCNSCPVMIVTRNLPKDVSIEILKNLTVEHKGIWTDVINLTLVDQSTERGDDILNTLMQLYDEQAMASLSQKTANTVKFLDKRIKELTGRLKNIESGIADYKGENLISNSKSNQGMYFKDREESNFMLNRFKVEVADLNYIKETMRKNMGSNKYIPSDIGIENYTITKQIEDYNALQTVRNDLAATTGEGNPKVLDLDRQLNIYRNTIFTTIDQTTKVMKTKLNCMNTASGNLNQRMSSFAQHDKFFMSTDRGKRVLEELYTFIYFEKEKGDIALSHSVSTIRVLQKSYGSSAPIAPLKKQIMLLGFVLGMTLPFVSVFYKTINDDKIYTQTDLEDLQLPIVGEIPSMTDKLPWYKRLPFNKKKGGKKEISIFIKQNSRDSFNECMRLLRTNLEFLQTNKGKNTTIMMTSSEANCGKSFVAANMAASLSLIGAKVILVDLDMRIASTSTLAKGARQGASSFLAYKTDNLTKLIYKDTFFKGVDILPVGSIPPNPTELLQSNRMSELMSKLKAEYNYIVIDCPPIDIVADDDIIRTYADITLFVLRAGQTNVQMLSDANNIYVENRFNNLCAVLNDVKYLKGKNSSYYNSTSNEEKTTINEQSNC